MKPGLHKIVLQLIAVAGALLCPSPGTACSGQIELTVSGGHDATMARVVQVLERLRFRETINAGDRKKARSRVFEWREQTGVYAVQIPRKAAPVVVLGFSIGKGKACKHDEIVLFERIEENLEEEFGAKFVGAGPMLLEPAR